MIHMDSNQLTAEANASLSPVLRLCAILCGSNWPAVCLKYAKLIQKRNHDDIKGA
jgi:hypothetical protein